MLALVSAYLGLANILLTQKAVTLFFSYGFTHITLNGYGVIQLVSVLLLLIPRTRIIGSLLIGFCLMMATLVFLSAGQIVNPLLLLIGIIFAGLIIKTRLAKV
ncbi:MAG: hypothetical protein GKR96_06855 [Gammaproteobacteria bacterium]|nr:hypothetical protein [Gammaproteobacteria bacterium]